MEKRNASVCLEHELANALYLVTKWRREIPDNTVHQGFYLILPGEKHFEIYPK